MGGALGSQAWDWLWSLHSASGGGHAAVHQREGACCGQEGSTVTAEAGVTGGGQPGWALGRQDLPARVPVSGGPGEP